MNRRADDAAATDFYPRHSRAYWLASSHILRHQNRQRRASGISLAANRALKEQIKILDGESGAAPGRRRICFHRVQLRPLWVLSGITVGAREAVERQAALEVVPCLFKQHQLGGNVMAMQTDPVCGMQVDDQKAPAQSQHQGKDYYFCATGCKSKFDQKPEQYTGQQSQGQGQAQSSAAKR